MVGRVATSSAAESATTSLSTGQVVLIVLPATIALIGVIITAIVTSVNVGRAEDRRTKNAIAAQLLERSREATLSGLHAVAAAVLNLKAFNRSMYGNTGEGEDDDRSAAAIQRFFDSFNGLDDLTKASVELQVLGSTSVSEQIRDIRKALWEYMMSIGPPIFKAAHAQETEARIDGMVDRLIRSVREDFGIEAARDLRLRGAGSGE